MTRTLPDQPSIKRMFRDLPDAEVADVERVFARTRLGTSVGFGWDELLCSQRILIVSESGAGKTYECEAQQEKLWNNGEAAFFLDLATLATTPLRAMFEVHQEKRFDAWLNSQSEYATFFLDSFDELKLTHGKFEQALRNLSRELAGQLGRVRIIVTTRPIPIDRKIVEQILPIPEPAQAHSTAEAFADKVMGYPKNPPAADQAKAALPKAWRNVELMPLSTVQIGAFAILRQVTDPQAFLADIVRRDAMDFAERPMDLIALCDDWREHRRIRTHREQVETSVATKLGKRLDRHERADLSQTSAYKGASQLALAALLVRKLTLRHGAASDSVAASVAALEVSKILPDWTPDLQATLLERALFGFASYGRVRFHHRSVIEYLAAAQLNAMLKRGVSVKAIKRLLFVETAQGMPVVRPSMGPVAAWLALSCASIFKNIVDTDPAVILDYGDPQSLTPAQRIAALRAYVARYGDGGWRGLNRSRIQIHRFAGPELTDSVNELWAQGIENLEVRELLLQIIGAGKLSGCADLAYATAMTEKLTVSERSLAIEALLQINDSRLDGLSASIAADSARWPDAIASHAMISLLPTYMPVTRLSQILKRLRKDKRTVGDLNYYLPNAIEHSDIAQKYLDQLRQALIDLISDGLSWEEYKYPNLQTKRPDLKPALIAVCLRQAREGIRTECWINATLLAIFLSTEGHNTTDALNELRQALAELSADAREAGFWNAVGLLTRHHQFEDASMLPFYIRQNGGIRLNDERDALWVRRRLSDLCEPVERREIMLWNELHRLNQGTPRPDLLAVLIPLVADTPRLLAITENQLKPREQSEEQRQFDEEIAQNTKDALVREAEVRASWVSFREEVVQSPDLAFANDRAEATARDTWQAARFAGSQNAASGWKRQFIEQHFGKAIADRLRVTMMALWRAGKPSLRSERPDVEKNTYSSHWEFGFAGIVAEAEDPNWAARLNEQEAELACRYAPIQLNGFPPWLEALAVTHPTAVDNTLGEELSLSLRETSDAGAHSMYLQNIKQAPPILSALFVARIRDWLSQAARAQATPESLPQQQNLSQAVEILLACGTANDRDLIETTAAQNLAGGLAVPFADVWLFVLLRLNPTAGVDVLEKGLKDIVVEKVGPGVQVFAKFTGRSHIGIDVNLRASGFTPHLLLQLLRLTYNHVRIEDDAQHDSAYSPDMRDHAERTRNEVLGALLSKTGPDGWAVKLKMAADPLFNHVKDRVIALAEAKSAEEADNAPMSEAEFANFDSTGETPPTTHEAMFALMRDRLDDIDDLLLQDVSPREEWANIKTERLMRRALARSLRDARRNSYTIDQEAVTADEKETDIRFRSTGSNQQGVIELKLGANCSAADLFKTIQDQLLTKYMAAEECRAGCLLVTIARDRMWDHPKTKKQIDFNELMVVLNEEAERLSNSLGGEAKLMAKGLDLRPRLSKTVKHAS
jgi:hypothetical protein